MKYPAQLFLIWLAITVPVVATGAFLYTHLTPEKQVVTKTVVVTPTVTPSPTITPSVYKSFKTVTPFVTKGVK